MHWCYEQRSQCSMSLVILALIAYRLICSGCVQDKLTSSKKNILWHLCCLLHKGRLHRRFLCEAGDERVADGKQHRIPNGCIACLTGRCDVGIYDLSSKCGMTNEYPSFLRNITRRCFPSESFHSGFSQSHTMDAGSAASLRHQ